MAVPGNFAFAGSSGLLGFFPPDPRPVRRRADRPRAALSALVRVMVFPAMLAGHAATAFADSAPQSDSALANWISDWSERVDEAQATQPNWMTLLVTTTPRLKQELRYDQYFETLGNGGSLDNYGAGKGVEFIPTTSSDIQITLPPYERRFGKSRANGFGDWPFLLIKQRFLSANKAGGNYIVTGFFGVQAPSGSRYYTTHAWILTPTLAAGKGFGNFDVQATFGIPVPLAHENTIGTSEVVNIALQYCVAKWFWPEFEMNMTHWNDGLRAGKTQIFLTSGMTVGRFPITRNVKVVVGAGYQFAVAPARTLSPLTPAYQHAWILTARLTF